MRSSVVLVILFVLGVVKTGARPATKKVKEEESQMTTMIFTKATVHENNLKMDEERSKNRREDNLKFKSSNISDNEIFEQVAGKASDIDERALVFIEQRYKVPFLHSLQQKHLPRNFKQRIDYRTFLSNTDSNDDFRRVFLHKFPDSKRMPIKSHKDIYMGDKDNNRHDNIYMTYNNNNVKKQKNFDDNVLPVYNYRNKKNMVDIVTNDRSRGFNDNGLKDQLANMDFNRYGGDPLHNHNKLLRDQLINLSDHYKRAQEHESREKQLLNDIKAIRADIDSISAEHREYLELLKVPLVQEIGTDINKDFSKVKTEPKIVRLPPQNTQKKEFKALKPSLTQFYAPPTNNIVKSSSKSPMIIDIIPAEKESIHQQPRQPQAVVQPAYLNNPPDIDFHDSRILSKIEEMNTLSSSMDKDKRSSSTATFSGLAGESNRTTRASEMENPCINSNCIKHNRSSLRTTTACDCNVGKQVSSPTHYSLFPFPWKAYSESTMFSKTTTDVSIDVFQLP